MSDDFKNMVASSSELQARWHTITDRLADKVHADFGVNVTKVEMAEMTSVRLAVLSGDEELLSTFDKEIQSHADVKKAIKEREFARILSDKKDPSHQNAREEWEALSIHQRMARTRELDAAKSKPPRVELTPQQRADAMTEVNGLRGSARISEARRRGVA